jgi:endonuclease-3
MNRVKVIEDYLDELITNPKCELNYNKDYELLLAVMLSAQTTDKRVNKVTSVLFKKYDSLEKLKNADINDLKSIIRELGSYNKKAQYVKDISTILVDNYNSVMPRVREDLEKLPGVGRKTINVVFGELNIEDNIAVDTHVERVSKRLGLAKENDNVYDIEMKLRKKFKKENWNKRHKQLVLFGRYYCKAIKPECDTCNIKYLCKRKK